MDENYTGFTCMKHELFTEVIKELSPSALVVLVKMLTYQPGFIIRQKYLATQLGIRESKHMKERMDELINKGYLTKSGEGQYTHWQLTDKALNYKRWTGRNYYRLYNDSIEALRQELCDGEIVLYLFILTNALTHRMTNKEIEERTGINKKTVSRQLNKLYSKGYLHKEEVGYHKVLWSMTKLRREGFIVCGDNDIYDLYSTYEHGIQ